MLSSPPLEQPPLFKHVPGDGDLAVVLLTLLVSPPAGGAEVTRVVSAMDDDNPFDFNLTACWLHESSTAFIKRESARRRGPNLIKDLRFAQTTDILNLRADFGVLWDIGLHVNLPMVPADTTSLDFDRSEGANCIYPERAYGASPTCVDSANSTLLRDGILPGYGIDSWGLDSRNNTSIRGRPAGDRPFDPGTGRVSGPKRRGFRSWGSGHLGGDEPAARRHQADLDPGLRRSARRVQGHALRPDEPRRQHGGRSRVPPAHLVDLDLEALPPLRPLLRRLLHAANPHER